MEKYSEKVKKLQEDLRDLSYYYDITRIIPDGIYGEATREAVRDAQGIFGLPVTGEVNGETLVRISGAKEEVQKELRDWQKLSVFDADWKCEMGKPCVRVKVLQVIVKFISEKFSNMPKIEVTGVYDKQTLDAVAKIQKQCGRDATGILDKATWECIVALFEAYV